VIAAQHVQHKDVVETVAVDIGEIDAHGEEAQLAEGEWLDGTEERRGVGVVE
jgi:hypothetical protein